MSDSGGHVTGGLRLSRPDPHKADHADARTVAPDSEVTRKCTRRDVATPLSLPLHSFSLHLTFPPQRTKKLVLLTMAGSKNAAVTR